MWLCRMTVLRFSIPFVAPLRMMTLPVSSTFVSNPWLSPHSFRYAIIFSSRFDGRGIWLIFANSSNTEAGFSSILLISFVLISLYYLSFQLIDGKITKKKRTNQTSAHLFNIF